MGGNHTRRGRCRMLLPFLATVLLLLPRSALCEQAAAPAPDAGALLEAAAKAYYDHDQAGLNRATCYVRCNDILKTLDAAAANVIRRTRFQGVFEPSRGKGVKVKTDKLPADFGPEARAGVERFRRRMQAVINNIFRKLDVVRIVLQLGRLRSSFDVSTVEGKGYTEIVFVKKQQKQVRRGRARARRRAGFSRVIIRLDQDRAITRVELTGDDGGKVIAIKPYKYKGRWLVRTLDVSVYDERKRLKERSILDIDYKRVKGIVLPAKLTLKAADKKGKPLERRDEPNPVTIQLNKYEVEKR